METVWDRVSAQARRTPDAVAVRGKTSQTYQSLMEQAEALARTISERTSAGRVVAMEVTRPSVAAVVLLAAARCRCAVLPLNADSPPAHRSYVLADAQPALLVRDLPDGTFAVVPVEPVPAERAAGHAVDEAPVDEARVGTAVGDAARVGTAAGDAGADAAVDMTEAAYVIYTSGSTGRPKGVIIPHEALLSRLDALARVPGFGPDDSIVAMTAPSFDICMAELLLPLVVGGSLIAAPPGTGLDPAIFADTVSTYRPTVIQATPSFWRLALAWGWQGDPGIRLWCGGEALTPNLADRLVASCAELWNVYGPTEATIWATAARVVAGEPLHLGSPLPGARLCLADADADANIENDADTENDIGGIGSGGVGGRPVTEPYRPGEILLYGAGLAIGYLNRPELTAERFRTCQTPDGPQRCYRTGDLAQYREDGTLQFLGRTDGQIKLRGHRIELSEVESVAEEQPGIIEAAAILRDDDDPQRAHIALFVVTDGSLTVRDIRRLLAQRLPAPMRPSRIMIERSLPRTTSGKLDRVLLAGLR